MSAAAGMSNDRGANGKGRAPADVGEDQFSRDLSSIVLDLTLLSTRERDVLALLGEGHSRGEIARRLYRSPKTIDNHCTRIYDKLGVHSQAQLVRLLHEQGLAGRNSTFSLRPAPFSDDAPVWKAYSAIVRELGSADPKDYFGELTRCLCEALGVEYAGVSEYDPESREFTVIAAFMDGAPVGQIVCPIDVSPCAVAMRQGEIVCNGDAMERFPGDEPLMHYAASTYIGVGLENHWLGNLGTMWIASRRTAHNARVILDVLKLLRHQVATAIALQIAVDRLSEFGADLVSREMNSAGA